MALQTFTIVNDGQFLLVTNTVSGNVESHNLGSIKDVTCLFIANFANVSTYPYTDLKSVTVEFDGREADFTFDLEAVTNQAGWTFNQAGCNNAQTDIRSWANLSGGAGLATEVTQLAVLGAIIAADQDLEIFLVRDTVTLILYQQITDWQTGVPVRSFVDVTGTPFVPVNPMEFLDAAAVLNLVLAAIQAQGLVPQATEATLLALSAKFNSLGQKASAASTPVVLSTEQEAILATIDAVLDTIKIDTGLAATEITLVATNALLVTIDTVLDNILLDTTAIAADTSVLATPSTGLATSLIRSIVTGANTVTAGKRRVSFLNAGNVDTTVAGGTLKAGEAVTFTADGLRDTLAAISYNSLTGELLITSVG